MSLPKRLLLSTTCVWRPLAAIKWTELWFVESIMHGQTGNGHALRWLFQQKHLLFCNITWNGDKAVTVTCQPGLVSEKLRIRRPGEIFIGEGFHSAARIAVREREASSAH